MSLSKQTGTDGDVPPPPNEEEDRDEEERRSQESSISTGSTIGSLVATAEIDAVSLASTSAEELARRSGFGISIAPSLTAISTITSQPGAYHVRPAVAGLGIGPVDSVDGGNRHILQRTSLVRSTNTHSTETVSELSHPTNTNLTTTTTSAYGDGEGEDPIVAYLVEDAACEAVMSEEDIHVRAGGGGEEAASASRQEDSLGAGSPSSRELELDEGIVIATKVDRQSFVLCGRHDRLRRWHLAILTVLVLIIVVVVPVAVVLGGGSNGTNGGDGDSDSNTDTTPILNNNININVVWTRQLIERIVVPAVSYPETLTDPNSPQSRAVHWLTTADDGGGNGAAAIIIADTTNEAEARAEAHRRVRQRYALAVLYYSTGGGDDGTWKEQYGFLDAARHECEWGSELLNNGWTALECNDADEVVLINLWQNNLSGPIPKELATLPLRTIDFLANKLTGTLPVELTAVSTLNYLNLGYNRLTGTVPASLGDLQQITYLMMDWNDITGTIPPELGKLGQLSGWLSLEGNHLSGTVPPTLANRTQATWIYLNNNDLTGDAEFLCDVLRPVEGPEYTNENSTSPLLELWVDVREVNCSCCNCCSFVD